MFIKLVSSKAMFIKVGDDPFVGQPFKKQLKKCNLNAPSVIDGIYTYVLIMMLIVIFYFWLKSKEFESL